MWYWRAEEYAATHSRKKKSMEYIREKYGSERVTGAYRYAIAQ